MFTERITWNVDDLELVGELRLPDQPGVGLPAVALTGPFTGVKDQVVGRYAERLTRAGLVTLAFDHRGFGESGGRRGHENPHGKLADLRSAVDVLETRDEVAVDRIGLVGVCLGGGYAVKAAALDPRVRAVAGVAGGYNSPTALAESMGLAAYRAALGELIADSDGDLPAVTADGGEAAMPGDEPWEYYGTERSASAHWVNRVTRASRYELMTLDVLSAAALLGDTPLLVVHGRGDAYCSPELARRLYDQATGPKDLIWLDTTRHIDLYDQEPCLTQAGTAVSGFLRRHLGPAR